MSLGRSRKLYLNLGTIDTPVFLLIGRAENIKVPKSRASSESDLRESDHTKTTVGNVKIGLEFEYRERPDAAADPVLAKLKSAVESGDEDDSTVHIAILRGLITDTGVTGTVGLYCITDGGEDYPHNERVKHSFKCAESDAYVDGAPYDVQPYVAT